MVVEEAEAEAEAAGTVGYARHGVELALEVVLGDVEVTLVKAELQAAVHACSRYLRW